MPHQYMSNKIEGISLQHGIRKSSLTTTRKLIDDVIIRYILYKIHKIQLLSAMLFLQIGYFSFSSVQPIQTAIMRAELHRRGIAQMRVSDYLCLDSRML